MKITDESALAAAMSQLQAIPQPEVAEAAPDLARPAQPAPAPRPIPDEDRGQFRVVVTDIQIGFGRALWLSICAILIMSLAGGLIAFVWRLINAVPDVVMMNGMK